MPQPQHGPLSHPSPHTSSLRLARTLLFSDHSISFVFLFSPCSCSLLYSNPPLQNFLLILQGMPDTTFSEEPVCSLQPQSPLQVRAPNSLHSTHRVLHISLVNDLLYNIVQDIVINFSSACPLWAMILNKAMVESDLLIFLVPRTVFDTWLVLHKS